MGFTYATIHSQYSNSFYRLVETGICREAQPPTSVARSCAGLLARTRARELPKADHHIFVSLCEDIVHGFLRTPGARYAWHPLRYTRCKVASSVTVGAQRLQEERAWQYAAPTANT